MSKPLTKIERLILKHGGKSPFRASELAAEAPAPRLNGEIAAHGPELTTAALEAWERRLNGEAIIDVAHSLGLSIESAKELIRSVHAAIHEDLKENLSLNRQLDLERLDGLLRTYYPQARGGDLDAANFVIKSLQHRAKLTGAEPLPDPGRTNQPQAVLVWIQQQLPSINRIVDALPLEQ